MDMILKDICKKYSKLTIIQRQDIIIRNGELSLFVGVNGSGKTTLIKCILSHINYQGKIDYNNEIFSYMPDKVYLPSYMKVIDYLTLFAGYDIICKELEKFKILDAKNRYLYQLSKGMSQKVSLISTLTKNATCYIFDEPTSGLDKESIELFVKEIEKLLKLDKKVIVITHNINFYNNLKYHLYEISEISEKIN